MNGISDGTYVRYPAVAVQDSGAVVWGDINHAFGSFSGTTLKMEKDASSTANFTLASGKTLDLNGKTLTIGGGTLTFADGSIVTGSGSIVENGGTGNALPGAKFSFDPSALIADAKYKAEGPVGGVYTIGYNHICLWSTGFTSGNVMTITCGGSGTCQNKGTATLTLNVSSANKPYDGTATMASVTPNNFDCTGWSVGGVTYKKSGVSIGSTAPSDVGSYTAEAIVTTTDSPAKQYTLSKGFEITQVDLSTATVEVVLENDGQFTYDGEEKTAKVTSVKVGNYVLKAGTDYTVSGNKGTWYKDYELTIAAAGSNFKGSTTANWRINNVTTTSGGAITASAAAGGLSTADGQNFGIEVANSGNLEYVYDSQSGTHTWWATLTLTYEKDIDNCESLSDDYGHAYYTTPTAARFTVDGETYTVDAVKQDGGSHDFAHSSVSVSTASSQYYYGRISSWIYDISYVETITYSVRFSLAEAEAAADAKKPLSFTINAGAVQESSDKKGVQLRAVAFKDYTITIPVNDPGFKLYAGNAGTERRRVYPEHKHAWTFKPNNTDGTMTATCGEDDCDHSEATISMNGTASRDYNGEPLTLELSDTTEFTTHTGASVGGIVYEALNGGSLTDGKPFNAGTYKASVTVTDKANGTHVFSKTIEIGKVSIADAEVVLGLGTEPWYTKAEQSQTVTSVTASGLSAAYDASGTFKATDCGTYSIKLTGTGNFTGEKTVEWTIKEATGTLVSVGAAHCSTEGNVTTVDVSQSAKLKYDGGGWWIEAAFAWSSWDAANARFTIDGTTYTGSQLEAGATWHDAWYMLRDGNTTKIYISFVAQDIADHVSDGKLSYTVNVGSIGTVKFQDYTFVVPIDQNLVLYNPTTGEQGWPVHTHDWSELAVEDDTAIMRCSDCTIGSVWVRLNVADKTYDGVAIASSISKSDWFDVICNGVEVGQVSYCDADGNAYSYYDYDDKATYYVPKFTGNYQARLTVGDQTIVVPFEIKKPSEGYVNGWEVKSTGVRYDQWQQAIQAAANVDTIYYRDGTRKFEKHEFSVGEKNITLDFGGNDTVLTYTNGTKDMTLKNEGPGTLTFQNVTIRQPNNGATSYQISAEGKIVFGEGVKVVNEATNLRRYCTITSSGELIVSNGLYECEFAGTSKLRGGRHAAIPYYESLLSEVKYKAPVADSGHIVRTKSVTVDGVSYTYDIVRHEHSATYFASGNKITATCGADDHEFCGYVEKTVELKAVESPETGSPYAGASLETSDGFPIAKDSIAISYYAGDKDLGTTPPTKFGTYVAKIKIDNAEASTTFTITLAEGKTDNEIKIGTGDRALDVKIPSAFISNQVVTAGKTTDEIVQALNENGANGISKIESYVLGLDPNVETSVPVVLPVQTSSATTLRLDVGGISVKTDAGVKVKYSIETSSSPDFANSTVGKQQDLPTFDLLLPESGVMYYRAKIDLAKPE